MYEAVFSPANPNIESHTCGHFWKLKNDMNILALFVAFLYRHFDMTNIVILGFHIATLELVLLALLLYINLCLFYSI